MVQSSLSGFRQRSFLSHWLNPKLFSRKDTEGWPSPKQSRSNASEKCLQTSVQSDESFRSASSRSSEESVKVAVSPELDAIVADIEERSKATHHNISYSYGHIQLIMGPMFSGKTTELVRRIRRYGFARKQGLVIKYRKDTRYQEPGDQGEFVATHDRHLLQAVACERLGDLEVDLSAFEVIGIDEGQFFPDLVQFCERMANDGKIVIVAALDGTFQRKPFGPILELIPLSEMVTKLSAVCTVCAKDAAFTRRISDETALEVIGGSDKYIAVCRSCYHAYHPLAKPTPSAHPNHRNGTAASSSS